MQMNDSSTLEKYFKDITAFLFNELQGDEKAHISFEFEDSHFCRFNDGKIRQNTEVHQTELHLQFIKGNKQIAQEIDVTGNIDTDRENLGSLLSSLRKTIERLPEDPYIVFPEKHESSNSIHRGELLAPPLATKEVLSAFENTPSAGIYTGGPIGRAYANSEGCTHWFEMDNFFVDYSMYTGNDKAVKGLYSGSNFNTEIFDNQVNQKKEQLKVMGTPPKNVPRGGYRTYLAPAAVNEIVETMTWSSLSTNAVKTGNSPFAKLVRGEKSLSADFNLTENFDLGLTPRFNAVGELAPQQLGLIKGGRVGSLLTSSRSAKEFGVDGNFANSSESPRSVELHAGSLPVDDILKELDTGLYCSNLHYLNWSDRMSARITGMTRFACFWVEGGEVKAPIKDLRFDVSVYDIFGDNLIGLTSHQDVHNSTTTYGSRHLEGTKVPGALINDFTFTL